MYQDFILKIKNAAASVRLSVSAKTRMRENLLVRMAMPDEAPMIIRPASAVFPLFSRRQAAVFAAAVLVVLLGAGTSYAAEGALPGDLLYPVKLEVNERVVGALKTSPEQKAAWSVARAARRLDEAVELAADRKLDPELKGEVEANFETQAAVATQDISRLKDAGDIVAVLGLSSDFEAALAGHARVLQGIEDRDDADRSGAVSESIKLKTKAALRIVRAERIAAEATLALRATSSEAEVERTRVAAARAFDYTRALRAARNASSSSEAETEAAAHIEAAHALGAAAKEKVSLGAYTDAARLANQALRVAEESRILLRAQSRLESSPRMAGVDKVNLFKSEIDDDGEDQDEAELLVASPASSTTGVVIPVAMPLPKPPL